jgi:hypothetical protein
MRRIERILADSAEFNGRMIGRQNDFPIRKPGGPHRGTMSSVQEFQNIMLPKDHSAILLLICGNPPDPPDPRSPIPASPRKTQSASRTRVVQVMKDVTHPSSFIFHPDRFFQFTVIPLTTHSNARLR